MTAPVLPWFPPAVRALLMADARFAAACGGRCSTRPPTNKAEPYATIQATAVPINASAGAWSPLAQIDGWCPPGGARDPEEVAWDIAAAAAAVLSRARNVPWQNVHYRARVTDGPIADIDTSRGASAPLYRATVRAIFTVHAR